MSSVDGSPSEEGDQVEAAGIVEGMEKVNLEDADFSLELLTQHFKDSTAAPGDHMMIIQYYMACFRSLLGQLCERLQRSIQVPESVGNGLWLGG